MTDRMTVTDIARHMLVSRPTAYRVIASSDFPDRGEDGKWSTLDVLAWLDSHSIKGSVVGGVVVSA